MTTDPIHRLLQEHATLLAQFEPLRTAVRELEAGGAAAVPTVLPVLREVSRIMSTDLVAHAKREDDAFFPAVERAMGEDFGPTSIMRMEHVEIHQGAELFRTTLKQLQEVDHPAIVERGERLRSLSEQGGDAGQLHDLCTDLLARIDDHFAKEEQILFPMSREILDPADLQEVARLMEAMDAPRT